MATYDKMTSLKNPGRSVQVESAIRDGSGKNIENNYAKQNGYYSTLTSGLSDALTPYGENSGANDTTPFVFQSTGGSSDVGSKAYLKALRGNSVAFNQLVQNIKSSANPVARLTFLSSSNGVLTYSCDTSTNFAYGQTVKIVSGHKYYYRVKATLTTAGSCSIRFLNTSYNEIASVISVNVIVGKNDLYGIATATGSDSNAMICLYNAPATQGDSVSFYEWQLFDLTQMFGAGKEPTSVLEFNRLFPKAYYEYNVGELLSCKVNGIKNVGYNAFDGNWTKTLNDTIFTFTNFVRVVAGQTYTAETTNMTFQAMYFDCYDGNYNLIGNPTLTVIDSNSRKGVIPDNCEYVKVRVYNANGIVEGQFAFHLTWDSARTGYEPYKSETYALPNVELKSAGSVYDELKPDGTLIRRVGVVDLGTLDWGYNSTYDRFGVSVASLNGVGGTATVPANAICQKYANVNGNTAYGGTVDKCISFYDQALYLTDKSYGTDAAALKVALSGVYLFYELATPTEEQTTNTYQEIQDIDDFGTQEFLYDSDIAIPVPQGNDFFYPVDYKAFIDSLGGREDIEYSADEIVSQTELEAAIQPIVNRIPELPSDAENGTYTLKATVDTGTINYTWIKDE